MNHQVGYVYEDSQAFLEVWENGVRVRRWEDERIIPLHIDHDGAGNTRWWGWLFREDKPVSLERTRTWHERWSEKLAVATDRFERARLSWLVGQTARAIEDAEYFITQQRGEA